MNSEESIGQKITEIRTRKNGELRLAANEDPELTVTLTEVGDAVDEALVQVSQALTDALSGEDRDEQAERERWWRGYEPGPYESFRGGITENYPLPRTSSDSSSWWDGAPEWARS